MPAGVLILGTPGEAISQLQGVPEDIIGLNLKGTATVRNLIVEVSAAGSVGRRAYRRSRTWFWIKNVLRTRVERVGEDHAGDQQGGPGPPEPTRPRPSWAHLSVSRRS